jgi:hypothetical protein
MSIWLRQGNRPKVHAQADPNQSFVEEQQPEEEPGAPKNQTSGSKRDEEHLALFPASLLFYISASLTNATMAMSRLSLVGARLATR